MIASLGVAIPGFWLAMIFGGRDFTEAELAAGDRRQILQHLACGSDPACLAAGYRDRRLWMAEVARQLRGSLLEVLSSQYVRTLHAKGLSMTRILWQHG